MAKRITKKEKRKRILHLIIFNIIFLVVGLCVLIFDRKVACYLILFPILLDFYICFEFAVQFLLDNTLNKQIEKKQTIKKEKVEKITEKKDD